MNSASRTTPSMTGNDPWIQCESPWPANAGITMKIALKNSATGSDRPADRLLGDLLFLGDLLVRRPRERAVAEPERLGEARDAAQDRDVAVLVGPARRPRGRRRRSRRRACAPRSPTWTRRASSRLRGPPGRPCSGVRPCPRIGSIGWLRRLGGRGLLLGVPALEALDAATGVNELLLARVEGVALRAELDTQRRRPSSGS